MDEEFQEELMKLIANILNSEKLAVKNVNGSDQTGNDYLKFIESQLKTFQTDEALQAQTVYDSTIKKEMEKLVNSCLELYLDLGNKGTVNSKEDLEALHQSSKKEALKTYDETKKLGSAEDFTKFRTLLEKRIEKTYVEVKAQLEKEQKALQAAKEKLRLEMEEKQKIEVERMENEKKAAEDRLEAEKQKAKEKLEHEEKLKQQEIAELNKKAELEQKALEEQKEQERLKKDEEIKRIEDDLEAKRIEAEKVKKEKEEKEQKLKMEEEEERIKKEKLEKMKEAKLEEGRKQRMREEKQMEMSRNSGKFLYHSASSNCVKRLVQVFLFVCLN